MEFVLQRITYENDGIALLFGWLMNQLIHIGYESDTDGTPVRVFYIICPMPEPQGQFAASIAMESVEVLEELITQYY